MARSNGNAPVVETVEPENFPLTFVINGLAYDTTWDKIPLSNKIGAVKKVIKHKLSNECYSAAIAVEAIKTGAGLTAEMSKEDRKAALDKFRETETGKAAWDTALNEAVAKMWTTVHTDGEITETDRPRGDSFEAELSKQVDRQLAAEFKGKKDRATGKAIKIPSNDTDVVTFADGETWTRKELRDDILDRFGDELREKARQAIELRKAKPSTDTADVVDSAASMGFRKKPVQPAA